MWVIFHVNSPTLCVLIGAFNPLTFKVIIDRYLLIFPICTCVPLSLALFLPLNTAVPLVSPAMLVSGRSILLAFFCLGNSLFHHPLQLRDLMGRVVLVAHLCFSLVGIFLVMLTWLAVFLLRNQLPAFSEPLCVLLLVSSCCF